MTGDLNRQRVLNFLDVFYSGDIEGALARCTDDVEFIANAPVDLLPHMGHRHGKAAMREMWTTIHARYSEMRCEVPIIVAEGDKVAANIRVFFRKRSNARMVQFDIAAFYHASATGRIAQIREIIDTFDLVEQVLERDVSAVLTGEAARVRAHASNFGRSGATHRIRRRNRSGDPPRQFSPHRIEPDRPRRDTPQGCFRTRRTYEDRVAGSAGFGVGGSGRRGARHRGRARLGRNL